jgi:hypothetical protein
METPVYNCRSDTESPINDNEILLSTTYFTDKPWTFAVMYGCTAATIKDVTDCLERFKRSAFHPLIFPMIFVEHERKRLLNALDDKGPDLSQRILDLENRLQSEHQRKNRTQDASNRRESNQTMTKKDCQATKLWVSISLLKNGLEGLHQVLESMIQHFQTHSEIIVKHQSSDAGKLRKASVCSETIKSRLYEMVAEVDNKVRTCDGLLRGMELATQVVMICQRNEDMH